jgi:hypothetical protein
VDFRRWFDGVVIFERSMEHQTLVGRDKAGGAILNPDGYVPGSSWFQKTSRYMEESALIALAGPIAEARHGKFSLAGAFIGPGSNDFRYVRECLSEYGLEKSFAEFERRAKELVRQRWRAIIAAADQLVRHRKLTFHQVKDLVAPIICPGIPKM